MRNLEMINMELELEEMSPAFWMHQCRKTLKEHKERKAFNEVKFLERKQRQMFNYLKALKAERNLRIAKEKEKTFSIASSVA